MGDKDVEAGEGCGMMVFGIIVVAWFIFAVGSCVF